MNIEFAIKQKAAGKAAQCCEALTSTALKVLAYRSDDRILVSSRASRNPFIQSLRLVTRQGARSRTRWVIGVRHRKVTKKLFSWPFRARVSFCLATKVQKCVAVDPGTWGRIRMMTLGDNIMKADELERLADKSGQGSMHAL